MRKRLGRKRELRVLAAARFIYQDETRSQLLCLDRYTECERDLRRVSCGPEVLFVVMRTSCCGVIAELRAERVGLPLRLSLRLCAIERKLKNTWKHPFFSDICLCNCTFPCMMLEHTHSCPVSHIRKTGNDAKFRFIGDFSAKILNVHLLNMIDIQQTTNRGGKHRPRLSSLFTNLKRAVLLEAISFFYFFSITK